MNNLVNIYHPLDGAINHKCERNIYEYEHVATVEATSLEDAFKQGQNCFNAEYAELGHRSTCVGDILTISDESGVIEHYIVESFGFLQVPEEVINFINWDHNSSHYENIVSYMLDNPEDYGLI